jgi:hypothetical protein
MRQTNRQTNRPPLVRLGPGGDYVRNYDPAPGSPQRATATDARRSLRDRCRALRITRWDVAAFAATVGLAATFAALIVLTLNK